MMVVVSVQKFGSLAVGKGNLPRCVHVRFRYYCYGLGRGSFVSCGSVKRSTVCRTVEGFAWGLSMIVMAAIGQLITDS
jgi:hypothetical protein